MHITRKENFQTSEWSGGTTTELRIFPEDSQYSMRNFDYRVSTATVEITRSTFTSLPGVKRYLMLLEGEITLVHQGSGEKKLKAFEQDGFMGDAGTESIAMSPVVDFNLMLQGAREGRLIHQPCEGYLVIFKPTEHEADLESRDFYCAEGPLELQVGLRSLRLFTGDYVQLQQSEMKEEVEVSGKGHLVEVNVWRM